MVDDERLWLGVLVHVVNNLTVIVGEVVHESGINEEVRERLTQAVNELAELTGSAAHAFPPPSLGQENGGTTKPT